MRPRLAGLLFVNLATFVWATNIVLGRWLGSAVGPVTLAAARFSIGGLVFALWLRRRPPEERRLRGDGLVLLGMALTGVVLFAPLLYLGLRHTTAVNTALINGLGPLITGLLAGLLLREPMTRRQVSGALMGLVGVAWLIAGGPRALGQPLRANRGDLVVLVAVTLWGLYSVLGRRAMRRRSALSTSAFSALLGLPFLFPAALWEMQAVPVRWSPTLGLAMVYIGLAPTVVGFLCWNEGVRRLGPSGAMVLYNMLPVYGTLLGAVLLGEAVGLAHGLGGGLVLLGGLIGTGGDRALRDGIMETTRRVLATFSGGPSLR